MPNFLNQLLAGLGGGLQGYGQSQEQRRRAALEQQGLDRQAKLDKFSMDRDTAQATRATEQTALDRMEAGVRTGNAAQGQTIDAARNAMAAVLGGGRGTGGGSGPLSMSVSPHALQLNAREYYDPQQSAPALAAAQAAMRTTERDRTQHGYTMAEIAARPAPTMPIIQTDSGFARVGPNNVASPITQGGSQAQPKPPASASAKPGQPSEFERKAALMYPQAVQAVKKLDELGSTSITQTQLGRIPVVGNSLITKHQQQLNQAGEAFLASVLRPESGAAISESERDQARLRFLPVQGDSPDVLRDKSALRIAHLRELDNARQRAAARNPDGSFVNPSGGGSSGADSTRGRPGQPQRPASLASEIDRLKASGISKDSARVILRQKGYNIP